MASFFEKFIQTGIDVHRKGRQYDALQKLKYEELVPVIGHCCNWLLEGFSPDNLTRSYHPVADRRLANRIIACIEEWNHLSTVESLEADVKRCPNDSNLKSILARHRNELKAYKAKIKENENEA